MSCTAQHGVQRIAETTFEPVATQLPIGLRMLNRLSDGATAPNYGFELACRTTSLPRAPDLYMVNLDTHSVYRGRWHSNVPPLPERDASSIDA